MPKEFLLVHGACHGAWCGDEVAERLRVRGHRGAALDLPGHGRRAAEMRRASVASYAAAVADARAAEGMSRAILVGHSTAMGCCSVGSRSSWASGCDIFPAAYSTALEESPMLSADPLESLPGGGL